jgi:polyhydroxyalkanoate synthesis regulator phasin
VSENCKSIGNIQQISIFRNVLVKSRDRAATELEVQVKVLEEKVAKLSDNIHKQEENLRKLLENSKMVQQEIKDKNEVIDALERKVFKWENSEVDFKSSDLYRIDFTK